METSSTTARLWGLQLRLAKLMLLLPIPIYSQNHIHWGSLSKFTARLRGSDSHWHEEPLTLTEGSDSHSLGKPLPVPIYILIIGLDSQCFYQFMAGQTHIGIRKLGQTYTHWRSNLQGWTHSVPKKLYPLKVLTGESLRLLMGGCSIIWLCPYRFLYAVILDTRASRTLSGKPTSLR